jgi:phospholipase C
MKRATRLSWVILWAAAGCGGGSGKTVVVPRPTEAEVASARASCVYGAGMTADATLPDDQPTGKDVPINHIVLLMQENRSFDHYYSSFPGVDGAAPDITNNDSLGNPVSRYHLTQKCVPGGQHGWVPEHSNLDGGKNDNFVINNADDHTVMGYYDGTDLPYYYALASAFAISDRHFSSVLGPTWPNRMFYFTGTSYGVTDNTFPHNADANGKSLPNLLLELEAAKVSWRVYAQDRATVLIVAVSSYIDTPENFVDTSTFASDVASGNLASVSIVEGSDELGGASPDEDPPADFEVGQQFMGNIIGAVMNSSSWKDTAIFLTYDENGGMYDHAVPPAACAPDNFPLNITSDVGFTQLGFRVPLLVISPYAKRGYVSHEVTDQTSILRFVESRFDLPAMTHRDANAAPAYDMFDFAHPDFTVPTLPTPTVDQTALTGCTASSPPAS